MPLEGLWEAEALGAHLRAQSPQTHGLTHRSGILHRVLRAGGKNPEVREGGGLPG